MLNVYSNSITCDPENERVNEVTNRTFHERLRELLRAGVDPHLIQITTANTTVTIDYPGEKVAEQQFRFQITYFHDQHVPSAIKNVRDC